MRLSLNYMMAGAMVLAACTAEGEKGTDSSPMESSTTGEPVGESEGATMTGSASATDSEGTSGGPTEAGETETGGETETVGDTTEASETGGLPAECEQADPAVSAAYELDTSSWPQEQAVVFDVACVVDAVTAEGGMVATAMTCDVEGASLPATLRIAAAPEGDVAWAAGLNVRLVRDEASEIEVYEFLKLTAADDASVLAIVANGSLIPRFEPIACSIVEACGSGQDDIVPAQLECGLEGESVSIFSGHRGVLPIDGAQIYAIDVARIEVGYCCSNYDSEEILLRRVLVGP